MYRQDGVLREQVSPPRSMINSIVSRIKIMSNLDIAERRVPQDGKFQVKFEGRQVDFRVSVLPTIHGEKAVLRILDSTSLNIGINKLGFEPNAEAAFREAVDSSYGMVLVTGPTGSGKSTTLYASLREVLDPEENVCTVEDPVEYQLEGVIQVPVNVKRGLTFATAFSGSYANYGLSSRRLRVTPCHPESNEDLSLAQPGHGSARCFALLSMTILLRMPSTWSFLSASDIQ